MIAVGVSMSVPGGDGGGGAAAVALGPCSRGTRGDIFIEAPRRRPHTIPHLNWLATCATFFLDVTVHAHGVNAIGRPRLFRPTNIDTYVTGLDTISVNVNEDITRTCPYNNVNINFDGQDLFGPWLSKEVTIQNKLL